MTGTTAARRRPTTVWPTARRGTTGQDGAGDGPRAGVDADGTGFGSVVAHAIALYSRPGHTICDPHCTDGTVVVEAVRARRHALGIAPDPHAWQTARAALTAAKAQGATGDGTILDRPPDHWAGTGFGPADLFLTALRPPTDPAGPNSPSSDQLRTRLATYRDLSTTGGRLIVVAAYHVEGGLDLASRIVTAGRQAGWRPVQRAVALTAVPHIRELDATPANGRAWPAHHDVIIFRCGDEPPPPVCPPDPPPSSPAPATEPPAAGRLAA